MKGDALRLYALPVAVLQGGCASCGRQVTYYRTALARLSGEPVCVGCACKIDPDMTLAFLLINTRGRASFAA